MSAISAYSHPMDPAKADEQSPPITIFVSSIPGHDVSFTIPKGSSVSEIYNELAIRLPWATKQRITLTTNSRLNLGGLRDSPLTTLLTSETDTFIPLCLTIPLCGGKGGFGSQLRAQGGRMSSRKKRNQADNNSSSRNLEGRRIRTVTEAKQLAQYLAIKPEMEKREREERMKRWQDIVDTAERKEDEIRRGKNVRLDGKWIEEKEEAEAKTRDAILKALGTVAEADEAEDLVEEAIPAASTSTNVTAPAPAQRALFGWDEDDAFMSDSDEEEEVSEEDSKIEVEFEGKGKGKMV